MGKNNNNNSSAGFFLARRPAFAAFLICFCHSFPQTVRARLCCFYHFPFFYLSFFFLILLSEIRRRTSDHICLFLAARWRVRHRRRPSIFVGPYIRALRILYAIDLHWSAWNYSPSESAPRCAIAPFVFNSVDFVLWSLLRNDVWRQNWANVLLFSAEKSPKKKRRSNLDIEDNFPEVKTTRVNKARLVLNWDFVSFVATTSDKKKKKKRETELVIHFTDEFLRQGTARHGSDAPDDKFSRRTKRSGHTIPRIFIIL